MRGRRRVPHLELPVLQHLVELVSCCDHCGGAEDGAGTHKPIIPGGGGVRCGVVWWRLCVWWRG